MPQETPYFEHETDFSIENAVNGRLEQMGQINLKEQDKINPAYWDQLEMRDAASHEAHDLAISGFEGERAIPSPEINGNDYYTESILAFTFTIDNVRKGAVNRGSVSPVLEYNRPERNAFEPTSQSNVHSIDEARQRSQAQSDGWQGLKRAS